MGQNECSWMIKFYTNQTIYVGQIDINQNECIVRIPYISDNRYIGSSIVDSI